MTPTQSDVQTSLRAVLLAALPTGTDVVRGQANKVPEPATVNFVVMTPTRRARLTTNIHNFDDCRFLGSISGTVLTAQAPDWGTIAPGRPLWGAGVAVGTVVGDQISGTPGGAGTYSVQLTQTVPQEVLACGAIGVVGGYEMTVQLDFHGLGGETKSADNAQTASILLRDDWAVDQFAAQATGASVTPLHADEPRQIPFINGEGQYEDRWIVEVHLQVNETVSIPQQYMESAVVGLIEVDTTYPP